MVARLRARVDGGETPLYFLQTGAWEAVRELALTPGAWHDVAIVVQQGQIEYRLDGRTVVRRNVPIYHREGPFGIGCGPGASLSMHSLSISAAESR